MKRKYIARIRAHDKKIQTVEQHICRVARISRKNADKLELKLLGELIGLLHDFGKYSEMFLNYIQSEAGFLDQDADEYMEAGAMRGKIDHSTAGAQFAWG